MHQGESLISVKGSLPIDACCLLALVVPPVTRRTAKVRAASDFIKSFCSLWTAL